MKQIILCWVLTHQWLEHSKYLITSRGFLVVAININIPSDIIIFVFMKTAATAGDKQQILLKS